MATPNIIVSMPASTSKFRLSRELVPGPDGRSTHNGSKRLYLLAFVIHESFDVSSFAILYFSRCMSCLSLDNDSGTMKKM